MSANTVKKARRLVESGGVAEVGEGLYQVRSSSDESKSYMVDGDACDCPGYKNFYKFHGGKGIRANCSHLEAVRIFRGERADG